MSASTSHGIDRERSNIKSPSLLLLASLSRYSALLLSVYYETRVLAKPGHISVLMTRDVLFFVDLELDVTVCAMRVLPALLGVGGPINDRLLHQHWALH